MHWYLLHSPHVAGLIMCWDGLLKVLLRPQRRDHILLAWGTILQYANSRTIIWYIVAARKNICVSE